jgi:hypothetical protein
MATSVAGTSKALPVKAPSSVPSATISIFCLTWLRLLLRLLLIALALFAPD